MLTSFWKSSKPWAAVVLSAILLELPFPIAGPMPAWRAIFAWFGLVPLLWALLSPVHAEHPRPLRRAFLLAYACGFLWYLGNCYWIFDTMLLHGDLPPLVSALLMAGFSAVLALYFGIFGWSVVFVQRATGSTRVALTIAPFLWTALDLAAAHITAVPWDQLGYSQVDNTWVNQLAPWSGVYGITFLLLVVNVLIVGRFVLRCGICQRWGGIAGAVLMVVGGIGVTITPPKPVATETAVLVQPDLDVAADNIWSGNEWNQHIAEFTRLAGEQCKTYIAGIPQTGASKGEILCPPYPTHPALVVWPEAPAPFVEEEARFQKAMAGIALTVKAPFIVGGIGTDFSAEDGWHNYNSAMIFAADGQPVGRYDKIHLVPFGEFIPFQKLLTFAHKLTGRVSSFTPGTERKVFRLNGHRFGVFICYESVFGDEVRPLSQLGAEVLVNISDDGWYGDTSAPWQHLNMARMRAIENRRWLLRDTNNGVTSSIDPYGRVRQSIPRHAIDALPAQFAFRDDVTWYVAHGDIFAWLCAAVSFCVVVWAGRKLLRQWVAKPSA